MHRFRYKLTLIFMVFIVAAVIGTGVISANNLKQSLIQSLEDGMIREIKMMEATIPWPRDASLNEQIRYFSEKAALLKENNDTRVTFIALNGQVLGDSDHDSLSMDNHSTREEVQQALSTQEKGTAIRYSDTVEQKMLYVALLIQQEHQNVGMIRLAFSLEDVQQQVFYMWTYYMLGLFILFIVAGFVSYRVAKSLTLPLENMMNVAQQISQMNYEARVTVKSKDEIGLLGESINTMADSLAMQVRRITENETRLATVMENMISGVILIDSKGKFALMNRSAEEILGLKIKEVEGQSYEETSQSQDLTEAIRECWDRQERIREEMTFYYPVERIVEVSLVPLSMHEQHSGVVVVLHDISEIRRLEKMRSEFVANVSHELKTPIAAVKGFAETLLCGALEDKETLQSFLQIIYDESARLDRLIADILELSKIESKRIPLHFSPVHMNSFAEKTINMLKSEAEKKRIDLEFYVEDEMYVEADEDRLRQIVINLISNGINYTPEGGNVKLLIESMNGERDDDDERIQITVQDTGLGIPKKDIPRIFERFYRVDKARSRSSGGTGLGLSIVKHLVELHKGSIRVESELGIGSRFIIELPVIQ